jgi:alpha-mannosidase
MNDDPETDLLVVNPLPWRRTQSGPVPQHVVRPRGVNDPTAARHFQDRDRLRSTPAAFDNGDKSTVFGTNGYWLPPTELPGFGYAVVSAADLWTLDDNRFDKRHVIKTGDYRVEFDLGRGGVASWYNVSRDREWVDDSGENRFAGVVHERVANEDHDRPRQLLYHYGDVDRRLVATGAFESYDGFQSDWCARRQRPTDVLDHRVAELPSGYEVCQHLSVPSLPSPVSLRMVLDESGASMVVEAAWEMGLDTRPESTYVTFPFAFDDPTPYVDVGGQAMRPGHDQLSGTCHDYYTAQRWAGLGGDVQSVTVGCPINPLWQFGDFTFGTNRSTVSMDRALLLGWVTSNYWDTNFRARQPGLVRARYHVHLHDDPFDETVAHRVGLAAEHYEPLVQTTGEGRSRERADAATAESFLDLPEPPVLVQHVRPGDAAPIGSYGNRGDGESDWIAVVLRNASDTQQQATMSPGILSIDNADADRSSGEIVLSDGIAELTLSPRELRTVRLRCSPNNIR